MPLAAHASGVFGRILGPSANDSTSAHGDGLPLAGEGAVHGNFWQAAVEHDLEGAPVSLGRIWAELVRGNLRVWRENASSSRVLLVSRATALGRPLDGDLISVAVRILCGEPQKNVAFALESAPSTVSGQYSRALAELHCSPRSVPLSVVLAAQAASTLSCVPARVCSFTHGGVRWVVVSVRRPAVERLTELTPAEKIVAHGVLEGRQRREIACRRSTSMNTVSRQIHSLFTRLDVRGRLSLIRRAAERGAFE